MVRGILFLDFLFPQHKQAQLGFDPHRLGQEALRLKCEINRILGRAIFVQGFFGHPNGNLACGNLAFKKFKRLARFGCALRDVLLGIGADDCSQLGRRILAVLTAQIDRDDPSLAATFRDAQAARQARDRAKFRQMHD